MWQIRSGISGSENHRPDPVSSTLPSTCSLLVGEWTILDVKIQLLAWGARGLHCRIPHLEYYIKPACRVTQLKHDWKHFLQLPADSLTMLPVLISLLLQRWRQSFISMCYLQSLSLLLNINSINSITCSGNACIKCNHQELASLLYKAPWVGDAHSELWLKGRVTLAALKAGTGGCWHRREKWEVPFPNGSRRIPKKGAVDPAVPGEDTRNDPGTEGGELQGGVCRNFGGIGGNGRNVGKLGKSWDPTQTCWCQKHLLQGGDYRSLCNKPAPGFWACSNLRTPVVITRKPWNGLGLALLGMDYLVKNQQLCIPQFFRSPRTLFLASAEQKGMNAIRTVSLLWS